MTKLVPVQLGCEHGEEGVYLVSCGEAAGGAKAASRKQLALFKKPGRASATTYGRSAHLLGETKKYHIC